MHLVCARMKLICIEELEDDSNDIDDVFHVHYSDRFISVCGYIFAKENGWRCSSLDQERRRSKKVVNSSCRRCIKSSPYGQGSAQ